jgi:[ribosomal protein S5]-alanine N-acetyltransferase
MTRVRTERLVLRRARATDLDAFHALLSDPVAMRYWSTAPHTSLEETRAWLDSMLATPPELGEDFVIEKDGAAVGKVGCFRLPDVGFILKRELWGQGLAEEALRAFLAHLFATRSLEAVHADVDPSNERCLKLLARVGFERTGEAQRTYCIRGIWTDSVYLVRRRP